MVTAKHGPWVTLPDKSYLALESISGSIEYTTIVKRYRISTIEPKKEFVVGKWYLVGVTGTWVRCIAIDEDASKAAYCVTRRHGCAYLYGVDSIDWSIAPRNEHP